MLNTMPIVPFAGTDNSQKLQEIREESMRRSTKEKYGRMKRAKEQGRLAAIISAIRK